MELLVLQQNSSKVDITETWDLGFCEVFLTQGATCTHA